RAADRRAGRAAGQRPASAVRAGRGRRDGPRLVAAASRRSPADGRGGGLRAGAERPRSAHRRVLDLRSRGVRLLARRCDRGALAGTAITDTDAFGLDAAFPAALLALILPSLKDRAMRCAALTGSAIALAATPFLPTGVPVLLSLIAVLPLLRARPAERARAVETSRLDEGAAT